jgi:hypothetical protein
MPEMAWEGLERAGYAPSTLRGCRTGVFTGVAANEYAHLLSAESIDKIEPHFVTAMRSMPSPAGLPSRWDSRDPQSRSTPHAVRRWWPSIKPARHCTPVTAILRWPVE